jgi:two-component system nitrate/nitrite sensor histidine kinase NarX
MDKMSEAEFGVRLPIGSSDELGELASGFNRMADRLRNLYDTLEHRVGEKTRDLEAKNRELAVLYEIAAYLAEPAETAAVCRRVLERLRTLLDADAAAVRLIDPPTRKMDIVASINLSERFLRCEALLPVGVGLCGRAAQCGRSMANAPGGPADLPHCVDEGLHAMVAVPISSKNDVFGVLNLFRSLERQFQPNEIQFLEAVGQQLGVAIENRRLVLRGKEMAVSEERNLLAQELHDSIAQSLAFLNIEAQLLAASLRAGQIEPATQELERMREGIQESYDTVRELLAHFRIRSGSNDLDAGIRSALEKFEGQTGVRTAFTVVGEAPIPESVSAIQVLHIVQEALSNVRKHAAASSVSVELRRGDELAISVRDDGCGFDPAALERDDAAHVGIVIMRERAHRVGGRLEFESSPGHGTCVTLVLPKPDRAEAAPGAYASAAAE